MTKVVGGSSLGHAKAGGRQKGTTNKATADARAAIGLFVDGNAHRLTEWLEKVSNGDEEKGVKPNPEKAFAMFQSVVEYHVTKLARSEITGADGGAVEHSLKVVFGKD